MSVEYLRRMRKISQLVRRCNALSGQAEHKSAEYASGYLGILVDLVRLSGDFPITPIIKANVLLMTI